VLWRDAAAAWRCFEDRCPHRAAPLSQGRLERGALQCNYHGAWEDRALLPFALPQ
jgi:phenylpropionate dioxygenase-like ring-hydroxylating dioxygenase large terminal subunit